MGGTPVSLVPDYHGAREPSMVAFNHYQVLKYTNLVDRFQRSLCFFFGAELMYV